MANATKSTPGSRPGFSSVPELICLTAPGTGLRARAATVASANGADVSSLNALLSAAGATMVPIFGSEARVEVSRAAAATAAAGSLPELSSFYSVIVDPAKMDALAASLLNDPSVQAAYVKPAASPPVWLDDGGQQVADAAPDGEQVPTPNFVANQLYLEVAPGGIDARYAWTRSGGKGQGVRVIDVEGAWRFDHEDLLQNQGGVIAGTQSADIGWRNHGTAVTSVFGGDENAFGVTGIAPLANTRAISIFGSTGSANAIRQAADALSAGDIILIELHRQGPDGNGSGQDGFIAVEWWPDDFAAIVYAVGRGVIVIEAAGNGARDLNAAVFNTRPAGFPATWSNPFNPANPQSGAVVVGAGAPPPGTHGRDHGPDRSRLGFSNFGTRVDVQGWGREVTSAGYGDLQGGGNENLWYSDVFSGTSSASPIVVGAVSCMQGALRSASRPLLTPATARNILRTTGSPQTDAPGRPATQRIGNRPNLRQALLQLIPVIKIKDVKDAKSEKIEIKEIKIEKNEKIERKEVKEFKELKSEKNEKAEQKEFKEHKIEKSEIKEFEKRPKEKSEKEVFEKLQDKGFEKLQDKGFEGLNPSGFDQGDVGGMAERLAQLEQSVASLSHFIAAELRPDLGASALSREQDLQGIASGMNAQTDAEKAHKDVRDVG